MGLNSNADKAEITDFKTDMLYFVNSDKSDAVMIRRLYL